MKNEIMLENLNGKTALISGGTRGIGKMIAKSLLLKGVKVIVFSRNQKNVVETINELASFGKIFGITADVSRSEEIIKVISFVENRFLKLDILINNAGLPANGLKNSTDNTINYVLDVNLKGYMMLTKKVIPLLNKKNDIIFIGSLSSKTRDQGGEIYVATKSGIVGFSESLRKSLSPNSRVTLIEPGAVATELHGLNKKELKKEILNQTMIQSQDIADAVIFCLTRPKEVHIPYLSIKPTKQNI